MPELRATEYAQCGELLGEWTGWAEQRTKPGASLVAVKGHTAYSSRGRWHVIPAGASKGDSETTKYQGLLLFLLI